MLFTTFTFLGFLLVVLALFYILPQRFRRHLLLAASLLFYMAWRAKFVVLILGLITVDYFAALWISRREGASRRMALIVSLAANIGMLGWFKYANFAREIWIHLFHTGAAFSPLDIILPLGISFHTFQSISYVIDVYRGEQAVVTSYIDYALFVAFFPQLVAGPIVRAREFFHDLWNWRAPTAAEWQQGVATILTGFVKKLVFADQFALVADQLFRESDSAAGHGARLDRNHRLRAADFFRFLRLHRYRDRRRSAVRFPFPRELPPAVSFGQRHRILAALAHDAFAMVARLRLHLARRQSERRNPHLSESNGDHASRRIVARRKLEFRDLGRLSRRVAGARTNGLGPGSTNRMAANSARYRHVFAGVRGVGLFPREDVRHRGALCWGRCFRSRLDARCSVRGSGVWRSFL